jgi:hypothetical protein
MKLSISEDWRSLHKRLPVILSGVCAGVSALGPEIRDAWHAVPDDLKAVIPAHLLIGAHYVDIKRGPSGGPPPGDPQ